MAGSLEVEAWELGQADKKAVGAAESERILEEMEGRMEGVGLE